MKLTPMPKPVTRWERVITEADLINGWRFSNQSVSIRLIREGDRVEMIIPSLTLDGSAATNSRFYIPPLGFRTTGFGNYGPIGAVSASGTPVFISRDYAANERFLYCDTRERTVAGSIFWRTTDSPPVS